MQIIRDLDRIAHHAYPVVALGNFDGVHLGHAALIAELRRVVAEM